MTGRKYFSISGVLTLCLLFAGFAKETHRTTNADVIRKISELLEAHYIFPDIAGKASRYMDTQLRRGEYSQITDLSSLAETLTRDLQSISHDRHMVVFTPAEDGETSTEGVSGDVEKNQNYGFEKVEHLAGNVGYLDLREFVSTDVAAPTAIAALNFLANSNAIIIDVRKNGGGDPSMIQLISSYFFENSTHLNDLYWREGNRTEQYWTLPYVPGKLMVGMPLYLLTSSETFSAAEEFSNNMKVLKRAKVIGETTGGGANPGERFSITDGLAIFIPTGRAINPVTGSNWEGIGVSPDESVPSTEAFEVAYLEALTTIEANAKETTSRSEAAWTRLPIEARLKPVRLSTESQSLLVGKYGNSRVSVQAGELYIELKNGQRFRLSPLTQDTFELENVNEPRLQFVFDGSKKVTELRKLYANGKHEEIARE